MFSLHFVVVSPCVAQRATMRVVRVRHADDARSILSVSLFHPSMLFICRLVGALSADKHPSAGGLRGMGEKGRDNELLGVVSFTQKEKHS